MKPRIVLLFVSLGLGLIIAAVPQNTTHPYKLTAEELLEEANGKAHYYSADEIAALLVNKDPSLQLIDVRTPAEFEKFSLPGAINIPLPDLLSDEYRDLLDQDQRLNVFYSNGTVMSDQAWLITRQLGFENNYVLEGGLNHWAQTIMNPEKPASTSPDDEFALYDFRRGAGQALGGTSATSQDSATQAENTGVKVKIKQRPGKKKPQGGC